MIDIYRGAGNGAWVVDAFVTNGSETWLFTKHYYGVTKKYAQRQFVAACDWNGYTITVGEK
jgi:hypothetical protein